MDRCQWQRPSANALDVELGDATPAGAAAWVSAKLTQGPSSDALVYTFRSDWGQVINDVDALPAWMHSHVKYWIADPAGSPHILPGSSATQWYWGRPTTSAWPPPASPDDPPLVAENGGRAVAITHGCRGKPAYASTT